MESQGKSARAALKICGLRRLADVRPCLAWGVEFAGFNLHPGSKRFIAAQDAAAVWTKAVEAQGAGKVVTRPVAVVVDLGKDALAAALKAFPQVRAVQFHGKETPDDLRALQGVLAGREAWKAVAVASPADVTGAAAFDGVATLVLFDSAAIAAGHTSPGGSGQRFDWSLLRGYTGKARLGIAGGIRAESVAEALALDPALIDVCSGVETAPGVKDPALIDAVWRAVGRGA